MTVAHERPADDAAELIVVIRRLRPVVQFVYRVGRVEILVTVELEDGSVQLVRAGLGHDVDHGPAGAAVLGGERVRVDLELLHRVLTELIWRAAGPGASGSLTEERVVVVGAVDDQAVERAALAREADVAAPDIARDAGCQQREVDEVAAVDR